MRHVQLTITFKDDDGTERSETQIVQTDEPPDPAAEHRVAHVLLTEFKVTVGEQAAQKHNATAVGWLYFPGQPAIFEHYVDILNSQAVWLELANLVIAAEDDLILAQAFKALEPQFADETAIHDLYYVHDRKMTSLNQSVHAVIKVQELVNRLLHESLGGDLVDTSAPDWERRQLTRKEVNKGLKSKLDTGAISLPDFDAVTQALAIPDNAPKGQTALAYRNRLAHHIRPSVDYWKFFSSLQSRAGQEIKDAQGKVLRTTWRIPAKPPVEYRFEELYAASSEYLDAIVAMLEKLSKIDILRR
jgi:hypothetical protein